MSSLYIESCCGVEPPKDWRQDLAEIATAESFGIFRIFGIFGFLRFFRFFLFCFGNLGCFELLEHFGILQFFTKKKRRSYLQGSCLQSSGGSTGGPETQQQKPMLFTRCRASSRFVVHLRSEPGGVPDLGDSEPRNSGDQTLVT